MENPNSTMRTLGIYIAIIGILSIGLHFLDMNFIFLKWINQWGETNGWLIRGGITVLGVMLYFVGSRKEPAPQ